MFRNSNSPVVWWSATHSASRMQFQMCCCCCFNLCPQLHVEAVNSLISLEHASSSTSSTPTHAQLLASEMLLHTLLFALSHILFSHLPHKVVSPRSKYQLSQRVRSLAITLTSSKTLFVLFPTRFLLHLFSITFFFFYFFSLSLALLIIFFRFVYVFLFQPAFVKSRLDPAYKLPNDFYSHWVCVYCWCCIFVGSWDMNMRLWVCVCVFLVSVNSISFKIWNYYYIFSIYKLPLSGSVLPLLFVCMYVYVSLRF